MKVFTAGDLGNLVRERRHDLRMSQQALADLAGVDRSWLSTVEGGHVRAEFGRLLALVTALGMSFDLAVDDDLKDSSNDNNLADDDAPSAVNLDRLLRSFDRDETR
jgi:transcriptional regulator with XRE-family HTH domain